jgi:two-component system, NtrC family, sensor histidine kinase HydH
VDLRTRTSLFCGALALAIAVSILLRGRPRRAQVLFACFAADVGLWYLAQWLYHFMHADLWVRFTAVLSVLLPQFALHLFEAVVPERKGRSLLLRVAGVLLVPMIVLALSPQHREGWARGLVMLYVFGLLAAGFWSLFRRGARSTSRAVQRRVRFLVLIGTVAAAFTLADFLWFIGVRLPPVGAVLSIVFLFVLSESMIRQRLVDLYDILGQLLVSTAVAFCLAGIFYVCVVVVGGFDTMYLAAILASIVILVLFEPLREKANSYIHKAFFSDRVDLERAVLRARSQLVHVLELSEMQQVVMTALERSHRVTAAGLYLCRPAGTDFELVGSFGPAAIERIDGASAGPVIERLSSRPSVVFEEVQAEVGDYRRAGLIAQAEADERLLAAARVFGPLSEGVCLAIRAGNQEPLGFLIVADDRLKEAFSPDEVGLLETLALQIGIVVENSRQYQRMQERDRLAALGQMAAGLAHEVKNPLGAIKGAAQLLADGMGRGASSEDGDSRAPAGGQADSADLEFLGIILEEVDRLDRVVGSVLDYAAASRGEPGSVDVNAIVRRTLQIMASDPENAESVVPHLGENLPKARADAEQLRQVLLNLIRNAQQSMGPGVGQGAIEITTRERRTQGDAWVEIAVRDQGPGIAPGVLKNLFVPFFTTKDRGTGLGLAISRRILEAMGGRIEVDSRPGAGATFTVTLPVASDAPKVLEPPRSGRSEPPPRDVPGANPGLLDLEVTPGLTAGVTVHAERGLR